uniref:Uncharacterized protein n=1 Tax=Brassica campestris TaxID=3711 RepID=A0A3P6A8L1_BRACM|nr:unnamed protein product [Brassica rapa]
MKKREAALEKDGAEVKVKKLAVEVKKEGRRCSCKGALCVDGMLHLSLISLSNSIN